MRMVLLCVYPTAVDMVEDPPKCLGKFLEEISEVDQCLTVDGLVVFDMVETVREVYEKWDYNTRRPPLMVRVWFPKCCVERICPCRVPVVGFERDRTEFPHRRGDFSGIHNA